MVKIANLLVYWYGGKIPVENSTSEITLILLGFYELVVWWYKVVPLKGYMWGVPPHPHNHPPSASTCQITEDQFII